MLQAKNVIFQILVVQKYYDLFQLAYNINYFKLRERFCFPLLYKNFWNLSKLTVEIELDS